MLVAIPLIGTLVFSWLYMQWTHELGHIIVGTLTGAGIDRLILDPRSFSMTQFVSTPEPLMTAWGGPILGVLIGAGIPMVFSFVLRSARFQLYSIAGFVLLANGLHIGLGAFYPVGDAHGMLLFGSSRWQLVVFGVVTVVCARVLFRHAWSCRSRSNSKAVDGLLIFATCVMATLGVILFPAM